MIEKTKMDEMMDMLEKAYKDNDIKEVNRINCVIMEGLEININESTLDFEFIESIRNKAVYKNLCKLIKEDKLEDIHDNLKFLSSMVTHLIIESDIKNKDLKNYPIKIFLDMINRIVNEEGNAKDVKEFLQNRYGRFI